MQLTRMIFALAALSVTAGCVPPAVKEAKADYSPVSRTVAWTGGDHLSLAVPAEARFVPGPANTVQISGPKRYVDRIVVDGGSIRYDWDHWWGVINWGHGRGEPLRIVVTTPQLSAASVGGSGRLDLGQLNQESLDLNISGSGSARTSGAIKTVHVSISGSGFAKLETLTATSVDAGISGSGFISGAGQAQSLDVGVSGSGHADFGALQVQDLKAHVSGSGSVKASPKGDAVASISGSGHVALLTEPAHLTTHRSGSGGISHPGGSED
jgi:hypothetical protein